MTWDGANLRLYINGVLDKTVATTISAIGTNSDPLRIGNEFDFGFKGQIDEVSLYNRALTDAEIASIFNAGIAGKLKETTTTGTTATVVVVTVTYPTAATRRTQEIPLEEADMPALPAGMTYTGLLYDIATDAMPSGTVSLCYNLPAFASLSSQEFFERRILHLESGTWVDRTSGYNFTAKTICASSPSLSPFAIVDSNLAPTSSLVSVGGRVLTADGRGIRNAAITLTDADGNSRTARTGAFGYYRFDDVPAGESYVLSVRSKQGQFADRVITAIDDLADVDFVASP